MEKTESIWSGKKNPEKEKWGDYGAAPGIIQILHTGGEKLNFHPHIHCIVPISWFFLLAVKNCAILITGMNLGIPFIKKTFNGFGNAINYLGRYTHCVAISNSRIKSVTNTHVEFIRRFLMHVLPPGFQKIRHYRFLNNRYKKVNLKLICRLTGKELFQSIYAGMKSDDLLPAIRRFICGTLILTF